ncbi:MAG: hypothetical protein COC12_00895 [Rhodobacteraceae bacterium]|nr:MAG: hypothetical protein COC12_00895 [Paracoccaceae bacterium]
MVSLYFCIKDVYLCVCGAEIPARPSGALASSSLPHGQVFICAELVKFLVVHFHAFAFQQHTDPPVTNPMAFAGDLFHFLADFQVAPLSAM